MPLATTPPLQHPRVASAARLSTLLHWNGWRRCGCCAAARVSPTRASPTDLQLEPTGCGGGRSVEGGLQGAMAGGVRTRRGWAVQLATRFGAAAQSGRRGEGSSADAVYSFQMLGRGRRRNESHPAGADQLRAGGGDVAVGVGDDAPELVCSTEQMLLQPPPRPG